MIERVAKFEICYWIRFNNYRGEMNIIKFWMIGTLGFNSAWDFFLFVWVDVG